MTRLDPLPNPFRRRDTIHYGEPASLVVVSLFYIKSINLPLRASREDVSNFMMDDLDSKAGVNKIYKAIKNNDKSCKVKDSTVPLCDG